MLRQLTAQGLQRERVLARWVADTENDFFSHQIRPVIRVHGLTLLAMVLCLPMLRMAWLLCTHTDSPGSLLERACRLRQTHKCMCFIAYKADAVRFYHIIFYPHGCQWLLSERFNLWRQALSLAAISQPEFNSEILKFNSSIRHHRRRRFMVKKRSSL